MTLDRTKPVQTRDGRPVRILTWTEGSELYPIVGFVGADKGPSRWTAEGKFFVDQTYEQGYDLVNVPPKQTVTWQRYWNSGITSVGYASREAALTPSKERVNLAGLLKVTWEDDEAVSAELEAI